MFFNNTGAMVRKNYNLDELDVQGTGALESMQQAFTESITPALWRQDELFKANIGEGEVKYGRYSPSMGQNVLIRGTEKKLTNQEANKRIEDKGLKGRLTVPDEGYTSKALDMIIERKESELFRKKQIEDASGFVNGSAQFLSSVAAQALDPINVAMMFVPVVAPAKYASMIANASGPLARAGIRAGVGAVEGFAGSAIVEPFVYNALQSEQADYTMTDSLMNIGLGTVFGGGLHSGMGALSDALKRGGPVEPVGATSKAIDSTSRETKEALLRTAISMEAQGYAGDVTPIAATEPALNTLADAPVKADTPIKTDIEAKTARVNELRELIKTDVVELDIPKEMEKHQFTDRDGNNVSEVSAPKISKSKPEGMSIAEIEGEINMLDKISNGRREELGVEAFADSSNFNLVTSQEATRMHALKSELSERKPEIRKAAKERNKARRELRKLEREINRAEIPPQTNPGQALETSINNSFKAENMRGTDKQAAIEADEIVKSRELTVDEELEGIQGMYDQLNVDILTKEEADSLQMLDDLVTDSELNAKALEAAVGCRI